MVIAWGVVSERNLGPSAAEESMEPMRSSIQLLWELAA